ncbi:MAG TPA: Asp-tRNA(Asn)/Glu-tRNA(Gln) amidotransferase subunit GatC [Candidatus Levybacteria bacterium]|nr:Asp-tRNA(Asn)/Glu-tRNA(Gln) amidotransferase subunit GatC [Candidatus Levybacteria bacterium]
MKIDVKHIAKLANLEISVEEEAKFEKQLSEVLDMVGKLNEVDTTGVEETSQVTGLENVTREDIPKQSLSQDDTLSNASAQHNGLFMVKGIFEED